MINGLEGIPGSGKSYEATVFHVLEALKKGRLVVTNLPLNVDLFAAIDPAYRDLIEVRRRPRPVLGTWDANRMDDSGNGHAFEVFADGHQEPVSEDVTVFGHVWDYFHTWKHPQTGLGPLYVIDECHVALSKDQTDVQVIQWYKLHRHFNADVLLMTQSFRDINQPIARLMAMLVRCRKADFLGKADHYVRKVHAGYRGAVISTEQRKYQAQYFSLYKSHTQGSSVAEAGASDVTPFLVKWRRFTYIWLAGSVVLITWMFWPKDNAKTKTTTTVVTTPAPAKSTTAQRPPAATAPAAAAAAPASSAPQAVARGQGEALDEEPLPSKGLHLKGELTMGSRTVYLFVVSQNGIVVQTLTDQELRAAGYEFRAAGPCLGTLSFKGKARPVSCDLPAAQVPKTT